MFGGGGVNMREEQIYIEEHFKTEKIPGVEEVSSLNWEGLYPLGGSLKILLNV